MRGGWKPYKAGMLKRAKGDKAQAAADIHQDMSKKAKIANLERRQNTIRKTLRGVGAVAILCALSGCATAMSKAYSGYPVISDPPGAKITVNGMQYGTTPMTLPLDRRMDHLLKLEKEGCPEFSTLIGSRVNAWVWGNIFLGGLIGLAVDAGTGAMYESSPSTVMLAYSSTSGKCEIVAANFTEPMPSKKPVKEQVVTYTPYTVTR